MQEGQSTNKMGKIHIHEKIKPNLLQNRLRIPVQKFLLRPKIP